MDHVEGEANGDITTMRSINYDNDDDDDDGNDKEDDQNAHKNSSSGIRNKVNGSTVTATDASVH